MPEFFKKALFSRQLYYEKGRLIIAGRPGDLVPSDVMVFYTHELLNSAKGKKILYDSGYVQGKKALDIIKGKMGAIKTKLVKLGIETLSITGWGEFKAKVIDLKKGYGVFHLYNPSVAEMYRNKYGVSKTPMDYYLAGLFGGAGSVLMGEKKKCIETKCVAKGDPYCEFVIK